MKLYMVRLKENKEAVAIIWTTGLDDLAVRVDQTVDPSDCEYLHITEPAMLTWPGHTKMKFGGDPGRRKPFAQAVTGDHCAFTGVLEYDEESMNWKSFKPWNLLSGFRDPKPVIAELRAKSKAGRVQKAA